MGWDFSTFGQVVAIDLVLAGDNAVVVGALAAGLPGRQRNAAMIVGMLGAVTARIALSLGASWLLGIRGLVLIGGGLLFWVAWKMWRDLRAEGEAETSLRPPQSMISAIWAITLADISMSLDNVLGVSGAAQGHAWALTFGLIFSVFLMSVAASGIAAIMNRHRWIGYVGLAMVIFVAVRMVWHGVTILI